jgi:hypothetical protein
MSATGCKPTTVFASADLTSSKYLGSVTGTGSSSFFLQELRHKAVPSESRTREFLIIDVCDVFIYY